MAEKQNTDYRQWLTDLKLKIRQSQIKAAVKVNVELLRLYWELGQDIVVRQLESAWGNCSKRVINKVQFATKLVANWQAIPSSKYHGGIRWKFSANASPSKRPCFTCRRLLTTDGAAPC